MPHTPDRVWWWWAADSADVSVPPVSFFGLSRPLGVLLFLHCASDVKQPLVVDPARYRPYNSRGQGRTAGAGDCFGWLAIYLIVVFFGFLLLFSLTWLLSFLFKITKVI